MTKPAAATKAATPSQMRAELVGVEDPFLPPADLLPDFALEPALELAAAARRHQAAQTALDDAVENVAAVKFPLVAAQRSGRRSNLVAALRSEGHPAYIEAEAADRSLKMTRETFRMVAIVPRLEEWHHLVDEQSDREVGDAVVGLRSAIEAVRSAAKVPASRTQRHRLLDAMPEGQSPDYWWSAAAKTSIYLHNTKWSVDSVVELLEQLAAQITPVTTEESQ